MDSGQNFLPYPVAIGLPHNLTKFGTEMFMGSEDISKRNFWEETLKEKKNNCQKLYDLRSTNGSQ